VYTPPYEADVAGRGCAGGTPGYHSLLEPKNKRHPKLVLAHYDSSMRLPRALDVLRALRDPTVYTAAADGSGGEGDGGGGAGGWFNVSRMCRIVVRPDSVVSV